MKKITDFSEVSPLVMKYFRRGVLTNNFLTAETYKCEIAEGRLFFAAGEDYLNFFVKRDDFFQLYFYALSPDARFFDIGEKTVCEVAGDFGVLLEKNGFEEGLLRVKLEVSAQPCVAAEFVKKADTEDAKEIFELMKNSFDELWGYVPTLTQLRQECEDKMLFKAVVENQIAGVLRMGLSGKTACIKHLCVREGLRGRGLGRELCLAFLEENKKAAVWTGKKNAAALGLYKSLGFSESGTEATVYVKG